MLGLAIAYPCIDSAIEWQGIFLGSVHGYIKTIFLNNSKILVNRVVWLFRGNLEGLRLGLIPVEQFLTIVPGRDAQKVSFFGSLFVATPAVSHCRLLWLCF